ncbi:chemotaxis protein CheA [Desulfonatronovibrio magnus]|uniref:chemotaxis protein CheA n=1 Tax=Desulfonatronovibrio magnus TaxID=698827 RepID=UPI0005EBE7DE|nr:chemotaxis protein CheA [Desulfonatronovibrio magnus]
MVEQDLIDSFTSETCDLLDEVEPKLIELIQDGDSCAINQETLNAVFRLFHSMKGSARFLGLTNISGVTHEAETLLDLFRKSGKALQNEHVTGLCLSIDFIRSLLENIALQGSDSGREDETHAIIKQLQDMISGMKSVSETNHIQQDNGEKKESATEEDHADGVNINYPGQVSIEKDLPEVKITSAMRKSYSQECEELIDQAETAMLNAQINKDQDVSDDLGSAFRALHSIKGNSGFMGFPHMERLAHRMETALDLMRNGQRQVGDEGIGVLLKLIDVLREANSSISSGATGEIKGLDLYLELLDDILPVSSDNGSPALQSDMPSPERPAFTPEKPAPKSSTPLQPVKVRQDIRVDIHKLDALINLVGELVIAESMVTRHPHVAGIECEGLERATHMLRRVSRDLQDVVMSARMIPLAGTFRKMIRLVHDLAGKSGKQIELKLVGEGTEVDKTVIEQIGDPLVHIIRNAADHGIETPEERCRAGKDEQASITIEGRHEGGEVWILISDDGRGLNRERILDKARENSLVGEDTHEWKDEQVFRLIFEPGFSTAEKVTDVSGRGVGMDVVKKNIEKLKGRIDIRSRPGQGSTFILRIPLTLAIIEGMVVRVGEARYTIPLLTIKESFRPEPSWINVTPDGQEAVRIRDEFHPILRLHRRFNMNPDNTEIHKGILILVECDRRIIALFVDEILGRQETVIKGLSDYLEHSPGISGCTILGDGQVSLILDVAGLVEERGE